MPYKINRERLWHNLMAMAKIGATPDGGCNRQTMTDLDIEGRQLFETWCRSIGLAITYDAIGNMFARMSGTNNALAPMVIGSHLDTQPTGGKFDGVLGVLAGLEVLERLHEENITPERPIEIACWTNEEGARFAPAMMGSGVWSGMLDLDEVREAMDTTGTSLGEELGRHGLDCKPHPSEKEIFAYLELHIEQGPILEKNSNKIGVVTGAQGIRWYDIVVTGSETHAGPMPMEMRRDPVESLPNLVSGILAIGKRDSLSRGTIGQIKTQPFSRNVVPRSVQISVDLRHPRQSILDEMHDELHSLVEKANLDRSGIDVEMNEIWHSPVIEFNEGLVSAVRSAAQIHGLSHQDIVSGAGHDALMVARKVPTAMIFTPCLNGISHNPAEHVEPDEVEAGANVLLTAVLNYLET